MKNKMTITKTLAEKVLKTVDAGLCTGKGEPTPGKMCVEAAVCFALGLPHNDNPPCVGEAVRAYKIALNDCQWSSNEARAKGMRKIALAQLGSDGIDQQEFSVLVCIKGVNQVLAKIFRWLAERDECSTKEEYLSLADECENVKTLKQAKGVARKAYAYASAYPSAYASASASAYAYASAYPSAYASAYAYASASAREKMKEKFGDDFFLNLTANIALEALIELKSPGCEWLDLCD